MKRLIIAIVFLLVVVVSGVLENVYIDKTFAELDQRIDDMETVLEIDAPDAAEVALQQSSDIFDWWEGRRHKIELFTFSPDIRAFSVALAETVGSLECGDTKNALSKCKSLKSISKNLHDVLDFNVEDVI